MQDGNYWAAISLLPLIPSGLTKKAVDLSRVKLVLNGIGEIGVDSLEAVAKRLKLTLNDLDATFVAHWARLEEGRRKAILNAIGDNKLTKEELQQLAEEAAKRQSDNVSQLENFASGRILEIINQRTCFAAGTPVLTPRGPVLIENLRDGDLVLSRSDVNFAGSVEPRTVEKVFRLVGRICEVDVGGHCLMTTAEHPFYVEGQGWTKAIDLEPGDALVGTCKKTVTVERVCATDRETTVYNLRVADFHTYFVGDPAWGFDVWVHNTYTATQQNGAWGVFDDATGTFIVVDPNTKKVFDKDSAKKAANQWNTLTANGVPLKRGYSKTADGEYWVAKHRDFKPRGPDIRSHHAVMSAWMEKHFKGYKPDEAPTVFMPTGRHYDTTGVYNKWRAEIELRTGTFDWSTVTEADMRKLSEKMFDAGNVPKQVRDLYWLEFDRMLKAFRSGRAK